jgi:hypothetical protein
LRARRSPPDFVTAPGLHDYTLLKSVRAVCPRCFAAEPDFDPEFPIDICDGHLVDRGGSVYLRRFCRRGHGEVWSLYEEDAQLWHSLQQWRVPTRAINPDSAEIFPVPMGYEHSLDLTTQCNLRCPACFTSSSPAAGHYLPLGDALHAVKTALAKEGGRLDVVMLSSHAGAREHQRHPARRRRRAPRRARSPARAHRSVSAVRRPQRRDESRPARRRSARSRWRSRARRRPACSRSS